MINRRELLLKCLEKWGITSQIGMLIEEMGELLTAINKYGRENNGCTYLHVAQEIADVEIMMDQYKLILSSIEKDDTYQLVESEKLKKLKKLKILLQGKKETEGGQ